MEIKSTQKSLIIGVVIACSLIYQFLLTRTNKIVFCDVGQGAATFFSLGSTQILVDTGADGRVLMCIGKHMPFFDKTLEIVIISHNQKDHAGALFLLSKRYVIKKIIGPPDLPSITDEIPLIRVFGSVQFIINHVKFKVIRASQCSNDINESANIVTATSPHQTIFLTSDINGVELKRFIPRTCTILAVPHHGSKYGIYPDSLLLAHPTLAVISVGKKNTYGHPSKEALDILKAKKIPIWRTDQQGELVINL
ncbi:MAG: MBL fold metallo-hydrolase [Microgenomates group bacterium]